MIGCVFIVWNITSRDILGQAESNQHQYTDIRIAGLVNMTWAEYVPCQLLTNVTKPEVHVS